jgi:hypothetical protein
VRRGRTDLKPSCGDVTNVISRNDAIIIKIGQN